MKFLWIIIPLIIMNSVAAQNMIQSADNNKTLVVAHRGGSLLAPENTLAAFKNAIKIGAAYIELDVHQTKDKVTVVIHDNTINRTTTGKGAVNKMSFEKLRTYDAGIKFSNEFAGEKVPTLDETLTLIDGKCNLLIEIKNPDDSGIIEKDVVSLIQKHKAWSWCVVQSFNYLAVYKVHQLDEKIKTALLFVKPNINMIKNNTEMSFLNGINIFQRFAGEKTIEKLHALNKTVFVWTVNNADRIEKMIKTVPMAS